MKALLPYIFACITSVFLFLGEFFGVFSLGALIHKFFPCEQKIENSFPCYGIYDISFMILLAIITLGGGIFLLWKILK